MLKLSEHFQYYRTTEEDRTLIEEFLKVESETNFTGSKLFFKNDEERLCVAVIPENESYRIESSYYIGLGWLPEWKKPVYIQPKVNTDNASLDYIKMLTEALKEPENFNHLNDLIDIRFDEPWIAIEGEHQIHLTPFLIAQFLFTVRSIVRKGLKKEYYRVTENLQSKVKGKILVSQQIRQNVVRNKLTNTVCSYQEYGINTPANRFLKHVLKFVSAHISNLKEETLKNTLNEQLIYNRAAFQLVAEESFYAFQQKEWNPLYKEYNVAIQLGNQLLKLLDHTITKATESLTSYPPHWIDMSKLFELYVFKRLREKFTGQNEVRYHVKVNRQEPDFLISTDELKAVVDAKYKPRYAKGNPSMEDARQLAGYARLNSVYTKIGAEKQEIIPVYFVYPKLLKIELEPKDSVEDNFNEKNGKSLFGRYEEVRKSSIYLEMFMQEISLL